MVLKVMSVKKSDEIMILYFDLMGKIGKDSIYLYPYSAMNGYDIFDIDNALKIFLARQIQRKQLSEKEITQLSEWGAQGIFNYITSFAPDEFVYELNKLKKDSPEYFNKKDEFESNPLQGMVRIFIDEHKENTTDFFNFCLSLDRNNPTYWKEVYNRLGIEEK
jgi:hypothetical protein